MLDAKKSADEEEHGSAQGSQEDVVSHQQQETNDLTEETI